MKNKLKAIIVVWIVCYILTLSIFIKASIPIEERTLKVIEIQSFGTTIVLRDNKGYRWKIETEQSQSTYFSIGSEFQIKKVK